MLPRSEREIFEAREHRGFFDADRVRRILERAAVEQHRLDAELADTYSLEELEEMAAEAGISREALHAAIQSPAGRMAAPGKSLRRGRSVDARWIVVAGVSAIALLGVMIAFPIVAYVIVWALIVLGVLVLLGASPF